VICYNDYSKREEERKMMNWYESYENHSEDYEELQNLLQNLAEDAED
jgi:ferric-dicitrate binding protein FerR (iron transport regulator)